MTSGSRLRTWLSRVFAPNDYTHGKSEAFLEGFKSAKDEENPYTSFAERRDWREGREEAEEWAKGW